MLMNCLGPLITDLFLFVGVDNDELADVFEV